MPEPEQPKQKVSKLGVASLGLNAIAVAWMFQTFTTLEMHHKTFDALHKDLVDLRFQCVLVADYLDFRTKRDAEIGMLRERVAVQQATIDILMNQQRKRYE